MAPLSTSLLLLLSLSLVSAQSSSTTTTSAPSSTAGSSVSSSPSGTTSSVAGAATSLASGSSLAASLTSINSALPQTAIGTAPSGYKVPDLTALLSSAPTTNTIGLDTTYAPLATPTASGLTRFPIPATVPNPANYPALDKPIPTDTDQVRQWVSELDLSDVPNLSVTTGVCGTSPAAAADTTRCWWTCGQCTRPTDITACPNKYDWGLSYDDGPSPYTPLLLDYLNEKDITTTFFVVGSRVISRPQMLISEYMAGHQISVHTWSHPFLTSLTNEQIIAELGWSKKVIKETIGVTPNTFRPPYGDIDDRVRSIAAKMGLTPIIWTSSPNGPFDTTDWQIPGGVATGQSALAKFNNILNTATTLNTGFIVLEHDLYPQCVDLAVGYVLPTALNATSPFKLKSISDCMGQPIANAYIESSSNTTTVTNTVTGSATTTSFPRSTVFKAASAVASGTGSGTKSTSATGAAATTSKSAALKGVEGRGVLAVMAAAVGAMWVL